MTAGAALIDARLALALDASPAPVTVIAGGCGCGRTSLLLRVRERLGRDHCQYVDVQRVATTPERFHQALVSISPFRLDAAPAWSDPPADARAAFDASVQFLQAARAPDGSPAVFLLDEVLELRTFESFPGLRTVLPNLLAALADSPNRFVLATRFATRARRLLERAPDRFELHHLPPLDGDEVRGLLAQTFAGSRTASIDDTTARAVYALTCGHRGYVHLLASEMAAMSREGAADPLSALSALLAPGGRLSLACQYCYEFRLHRARGYGALKAILDVLAEDEPLTLTEISQRLGRTPGSTKDYLSWLEDVDLIQAARKRYRFANPMLRLWVRLSERAEPPSEEDVAREVHRFAQERLAVPAVEAVSVMAGARSGAGDIIEFD